MTSLISFTCKHICECEFGPACRQTGVGLYFTWGILKIKTLFRLGRLPEGLFLIFARQFGKLEYPRNTSALHWLGEIPRLTSASGWGEETRSHQWCFRFFSCICNSRGFHRVKTTYRVSDYRPGRSSIHVSGRAQHFRKVVSILPAQFVYQTIRDGLSNQ